MSIMMHHEMIVFEENFSKKYTIAHLQNILQLMGCKVWETENKIFLKIQEQSYDCDHENDIKDGVPFETSSSTLPVIHRKGDNMIKNDLIASCKIKDRQQSITIILGGTSGCGKSTLASLLASRFGITTILSTDNVRHLLRNYHSKETCPVLWTSSYHASEALNNIPGESPNKKIIRGYEAQSGMIMEKIEMMIKLYESRQESAIIEGVHLSIQKCKLLMQKYHSVMPFIIYISNESKHAERFAIRAKYMTLEPHVNKYIKYFDNIRVIQHHICQQADYYKIPKIDNTNVDRSLAIVHRTLFNVLANLEPNNPDLLYEEYMKIQDKSLRSKDVLSMIRLKSMRKRSSSDCGELLLPESTRRELLYSKPHQYLSSSSSSRYSPIDASRRAQRVSRTMEDYDEDELCLSDTASLGS